jgi:peptidoglycan/xylan/chitin deacetylase (PgdA/CDA1 family)
VRFLLTFDDGPSIRTDYNPTLSILDQLAHNDVQDGIKAIFFVQTRNHNGGGSAMGKNIMRLTHAQGQVLGLHSAEPAGHVRHVGMAAEQLKQSLKNGAGDVRQITGKDPEFVRPPGFLFDAKTQQVYQDAGLKMLLSDVKARDGVIHVFNVSLRRRSHIRSELEQVGEELRHNQLPVVHGVVPIVVTFHDVNTYTAWHLTEYLHILVEEAAHAGLHTADKPFFNDSLELVEAARRRAAPAFSVVESHSKPTAN